MPESRSPIALRPGPGDDDLVVELARLDGTIRWLERELARARALPSVPPQREAPRPRAALRPVPAAPPAPTFERVVELDAGPFADFDELTAFELALAAMPGVETVTIRRFFGARAVLEVAAHEPLPLVERLRAALPGGFAVGYEEPAALKITLPAPLARTA